MNLGISKKEAVMLAVLISGAIVAVLNLTLMTPALPAVMLDTGVPQTTVQWLTSGYSITEAVVIPLAAYLMGRFSTRKLFIGGMVVFTLGSITAAMAPAFLFILLGRVMQAVATGFMMPMVFSVVLLVVPKENRGAAMGLIGLVIGFAPTVGPPLAGVLVDTMGWREIFVVVAIVSALITVLAFFTLENYGSFERGKFDALSVLLSSVGLVCLLYGFSSFSSAENHLVTLAMVVVGIVFVSLYARRQLRLDEPMLQLRILRVRGYLISVIILAIFQASLIGLETIIPLYIQDVLGESATVSGLTLLPGSLISSFAGVISGIWFDKMGVRRPAVVGAVILAVSVLFFFTFGLASSVIWIAVVYTLIWFGEQLAMTPIDTWGVNMLEPEEIRHSQSTTNTIIQVGGSFGTALLVSVAAAVSGQVSTGSAAEILFAGYHAAFVASAVMALVACVMIFLLVRDKKRKA